MEKAELPKISDKITAIKERIEAYPADAIPGELLALKLEMLPVIESLRRRLRPDEDPLNVMMASIMITMWEQVLLPLLDEMIGKPN